MAHPPLFPTQSPALLALCWGIAATLFVGLLFGGVLAVVSRAGPQVPLPVAFFYKPVFALLAVVSFSAFAAGMAGYVLARRGLIPIPAAVTQMIPPEKYARFMAVWFAHMASYLFGLVGGALVCFRVWQVRGRPVAIALLPRGRTAVVRAAVIATAGAVILWLRFRAP